MCVVDLFVGIVFYFYMLFGGDLLCVVLDWL